MQRALAFVAFAALLALALRAEAMETVVNVSNVGLYVGHRVTFCGTISQTKQAGKAFFINFGGHYPQHRFTNVIFKSDQSRFNLAGSESVHDGNGQGVQGRARDSAHLAVPGRRVGCPAGGACAPQGGRHGIQGTDQGALFRAPV